MSHEQRIQDLEEAVLHLSRAVNRMIEAYELELPVRQRDEGRMTSRSSDRLVNEALGALKTAVDLVSIEEHERS
jgi:hypothetical protein